MKMRGPGAKANLSPSERFHSYVIPEPNSGCWLWTGAERGNNKYGTIQIKGVATYAHRYAWQLYFGGIPVGKQVLHRCDNPSCVKPEHLFLGTHRENMQDKTIKGRQAKGPSLSIAQKLGHQNRSNTK